ncbi:MAG: hypothetical protein RMI51_05510 [Aquificaceae bacterium]|nr:hypothetical protein [Aquificaceae bacterium]
MEYFRGLSMVKRGLALFLLLSFGFSFSREVPFTLEDRDRLIKLDSKVESLEKTLSIKIEGLEKRIIGLEREMNRLTDIMLAIFGGQFVLLAVSIGFALWDRRTTVRPFEDKLKEAEKRLLKTEEDSRKLIESLKKLAQKDPELREVLKEHGIL